MFKLKKWADSYYKAQIKLEKKNKCRKILSCLLLIIYWSCLVILLNYPEFVFVLVISTILTFIINGKVFVWNVWAQLDI